MTSALFFRPTRQRPLYVASIITTVGGMSETAPVDVTATLLANRNMFKAFLASRVGNAADAEDLLQNALVKALERGGEIQDTEKAVAWFYRVLRNVVIDHARSRDAASRRDDLWASDTKRTFPRWAAIARRPNGRRLATLTLCGGRFGPGCRLCRGTSPELRARAVRVGAAGKALLDSPTV